MCSMLEETLRTYAMEPWKLGAVDVTLACSDGERIGANSTMLTGRSEFFRVLLKGPFLEGAAKEVPIPYGKDVVIQIIQFLWTDKADIFEDDYDHEDEGFAGTIGSLIKAADEYNLKPLFEKARDAVLAIVEKKKPSHLVEYIMDMDEPLFKQVALHAIRKDPTLLLQEEYLRSIDKSKMELVLGDKWIEATEQKLFDILLMWSKFSTQHKEQAAELIHHVTLCRIKPEYLCTTVKESGLATTQLGHAYKTELLLATGPEPFPHNLRFSYNYTRAPHYWHNKSLVLTAQPPDGYEHARGHMIGALLRTGIHKWSLEILKMDGSTSLGVQAPLYVENLPGYPYWFCSSNGHVSSAKSGGEKKNLEFREGSIVNFKLDLSVDKVATLSASVGDDGHWVDLFDNMLSNFDYDDLDCVGFGPAVWQQRGDKVRFLGYTDE